MATSNEGRLFEVTIGALLAWVCSQHFLQQAPSVLSLPVPGDVTEHTLRPYILKAQATKHVWCHASQLCRKYQSVTMTARISLLSSISHPSSCAERTLWRREGVAQTLSLSSNEGLDIFYHLIVQCKIYIHPSVGLI